MTAIVLINDMLNVHFRNFLKQSLGVLNFFLRFSNISTFLSLSLDVSKSRPPKLHIQLFKQQFTSRLLKFSKETSVSVAEAASFKGQMPIRHSMVYR